MPEDPIIGSFNPFNMNFDKLYRGGPLIEGSQIDHAPWDIGEAQPFLVDWEQAGRFRGTVLDIGCGLGENTIYLANKGYRVTGIDSAPAAVDQARQRAERRGVDVAFEVADALNLDGYDSRFDTILDSACYHCFDADNRKTYLQALHRAATPGAQLSLCCFADPEAKMPPPMNITEESLRATLSAAGWQITDLRQTTYVATADVGKIMAFFAATDMKIKPTRDEDGRFRMPFWAVQADRV